MKIAVWDTYLRKEDGSLMHFDILVPTTVEEKAQVLNYGNQYLRSKQLTNKISSLDRCYFCHVEEPDQKVIDQILKDGFSIVELENCH